MPQFVRKSRLERKAEEQITRRTVVLGLATVLFLIFLILLGLPMLVRFAVFLGDIKNRNQPAPAETEFPPLAPRLFLPYEATNSAKVNISGTAESKTNVELLKSDVPLEKKEVSQTGDFGFEVSLDPGENRFTAVAIGVKGQRSQLAKDLVVIFDDQAPEFTLEKPESDSVSTDQSEYEMVGKSEKGVSVTVNGRMAMVDNEGTFRVKMPLSIGKNEVEVVVRDGAGNETKKKVTITYDI